MKVLLLPLDGISVHCRVTPSSMLPVPIYSPGRRETMWCEVSCLRKQHDGGDWGSNHRHLDLRYRGFTVKPDVLFRATLQTSAATLVFWLTTCSEQFATATNNLLSSVANLHCVSRKLSLVFLANSFLNWNFDLEYYPAGEARVLSGERPREANLFKATTTNFTCGIKQNRKLNHNILSTKVTLSQQRIS